MPAGGGSEDSRFEKAAPKDTRQRDLLVARLRDLLTDEPAAHRVSMFSDRAFIINEKMTVHASKDRDLLVHIDVGGAKFSEVPGTLPAGISPRRAMRAGQVHTSVASVADGERLRFQLDATLTYNRTLAGKRKEEEP